MLRHASVPAAELGHQASARPVLCVCRSTSNQTPKQHTSRLAATVSNQSLCPAGSATAPVCGRGLHPARGLHCKQRPCGEYPFQCLTQLAALLRISDMEFTGTNSFFIRVLLDKKYALPYRVVRELTSSATCKMPGL